MKNPRKLILAVMDTNKPRFLSREISLVGGMQYDLNNQSDNESLISQPMQISKSVIRCFLIYNPVVAG